MTITRFIVFGIIILLLSTGSYGQSTGNNFIKTTDLLIPVSDSNQISTLGDGEKSDLIEYFDGLGRMIQVNDFHITPTGQDIIKHIEYDDFGRQTSDYLAFPNDADGSFISNAGGLATNYYHSPADHSIPKTDFPYGEKRFDNSPLNTVLKQGFPGASWQLDAHPREYDYLTNSSDDEVLLFEYNKATGQFTSTQYYDTNSLFVEVYMDENQNTSRSFKDKSGKLVLTESEYSQSDLRTYYIYDIYGNLVVVIQPEGSKLLSNNFSSTTEFIDLWCFTYTYDSRNRLIEKHIPGMKLPILTVYDSLDRVILTQNGNLFQSDLYDNTWNFYKYDALGRPVLEGLYRNTQDTTREEIQSLVDDYFSQNSYYETVSGQDFQVYLGYSDNAFPPIDSCEILKVFYYDDYDFDNDSTDDYDYRPLPEFDDSDYLEVPTGMVTGTRVKILLEPVLHHPYLITVNFYDRKSRIIQQLFRNHSGCFDTLSMNYSFTGDLLLSRLDHSSTYENHRLYDSITYDHARREKDTYYKIDNPAWRHMSSSNYNELGQLKEKNLHRTGVSSFLQSLDYSYTIRGWLDGINIRDNGNDQNDVFRQKLLYDSTITALSCDSNFNGNITANLWQHTGSSYLKGYGYSYDGLNRLTRAVYGEYPNNSWNANGTYSVPEIEYYDNGNIKKLTRKGPCSQIGVIDALAYYYEGNRIIGVNDIFSDYCGFQDNGHIFDPNNRTGTTEYFYDNNGNLTQDLNKGIVNIIYNNLNLPVKIDFENHKRITFLYDANGAKLRKCYYEDNHLMETTDYYGNFVYTDDHLDYILTSEGRLKWNDQDHAFNAEYFIRDHLGNIRSVITTDTNQHWLAQGTDYYPFGMEIPVYGNSDNQLKYNGKELQTEAGLKWYDYGARFYDPVIGRWHSVDPMAEDYYPLSPYHFAGNNPIKFVDLNGMNYDEWELTLKNDGTKDLKWLNDKGGKETQYVNVKWETSNEKIWDLGTETWNNWPNNELAMADIVSNGEAALGPWNESWWANASGRTEFSPIDPVDFVVGAAAAKWAIGVSTTAKTSIQYSDDLVNAAQKLYPNKAGITELHHIAPKYLGGAKDGALVPLDGAYHQVITNEFRSLYQYGLPKPGDAKMLEIIKQVYSKYPLPPGY